MVFTTPLTKRGDFAFFIIVFSRVFHWQKKNSFYNFPNEKRRFRVFTTPLTLPLTSLTSGVSVSQCACKFGFIDDPKTGQKSYAKPRGFVCRMRARNEPTAGCERPKRCLRTRQWLLHVADTREGGRAWRQARDEKGDRERRRLYLYSRSAISRSTAHDETRRRHLCYCSNE
jgi:hypothetical protein